MLARNQDALTDAARVLGENAVPVRCDVANANDVRDSLKHICSNGVPNFLINNAGIFPLAPVHETSIELFSDTVELNLVAPFRMIRELLPRMQQRNDGHIVLIGSVADRVVFPGNAAYAATKYGARALHEVVRAETSGSGVRCTLVSPAPVNTTIWDPYNPDGSDSLPSRSDMLAPSSVADAVVWALTRPQGVNIDELRLSRS